MNPNVRFNESFAQYQVDKYISPVAFKGQTHEKQQQQPTSNNAYIIFFTIKIIIDVYLHFLMGRC